MTSFDRAGARSGLRPRRPARAIVRAALLAAGALVAPAAAMAQSAPPAWAQRYFAAERSGTRFLHTWKSRYAPNSLTAALALRAPGTRYELRGTFRMAVLAVTYSDVSPAVGTNALDRLMFAPEGDGRRYSLNQYYREASGGRFSIAGAVTPWLALSRPRGHYGMAIAPFVHDALLRADAEVDWRQFDNDGPDGRPDSGDDDGFVDLVTIVHPLSDGVCRSNAGPVSTGWRVSLSGAFQGQSYATHSVGASGQRLRIEDFVVTAATHCSGSGVATVNIAAHELGHALGLPDLYDRDGSTFGVGIWDVMGHGVYLEEGRPALMSAWTRSQLGWINVVDVTASGTLTLPPAETTQTSWRISIAGTNEYLLLENRQRIGADDRLPGRGLLVWRVNDDALRATLPFYIANDDETRAGVTLLEGDGRFDLRARTNTGDAGDPLPGMVVVRQLADTTLPSIRPSIGGPSGIRLADIREDNGVITLRVLLGGEPPKTHVMTELLRSGGTLTQAQKAELDVLGNRDGAFDSGDVVAYLRRNGW